MAVTLLNKEDKHENLGLPPTLVFELPKSMGILIRWTVMSKQQEQEFVQELRHVIEWLAQEEDSCE